MTDHDLRHVPPDLRLATILSNMAIEEIKKKHRGTPIVAPHEYDRATKVCTKCHYDAFSIHLHDLPCEK